MRQGWGFAALRAMLGAVPLAASLLVGALPAGLLSAAGAAAQTAAAGPTLAAVRARGVLVCGTSTGAPGFSVLDNRGENRGLDADLCKALAAAVLGDPTKIRWVPLTSQARFPALQSNQIDVLIRTATWTQSRDTALGLNFTAVSFYDGQGFLVRRSAGIARAAELQGASICTVSGSTSELNLADWARVNGIRYTPVVFEQNEEAANAYAAGRCDAYSTDASQLAAIGASLPDAANHMVLPDIISKEPHAPVVRHGDDQWFDIVRWMMFALYAAEEQGVTRANVDSMLESPNPEIRRLLGTSGDHGPMMGLDRRWAYAMIKAVGNYGEIFDRNLGEGSIFRLPRGLNALWNRGGLMYPMPIR
ncbi:amino acid ABC transporter substrate-binding protein [Roseomonas sp. NAR14]|uniref:Amino acid ABC transporter substrate-binding protein n=1 Tax=Roseomonas acroporae TaxID=2937791 RepID=A0A9X1YAS9_9PROT|nr:amino acid ABC transporter substrate-binding protein [Roseomonas acroporae]MCK8786678.1 amino acid ABC transporter substrate-binding protein [Roseomonas acroporae]